MIKQVNYNTANTYEILNPRGVRTQFQWFALHGMGYLSKYLLRNMGSLEEEDHEIIAPQAPSKYYLKDDFKYVGASWLTKLDTPQEIKNNLNYLNALWQQEGDPNLVPVLFGFSQGVSMLMRWWAAAKLDVPLAILYAGGIPEELVPEDFAFVRDRTKVVLVYGDDDLYLTPDRINVQKRKCQALFGNRAYYHPYVGKHEVLPSVVSEVWEGHKPDYSR